MSKSNVFVFGGSSPIAIALSLHLQAEYQVTHFSRNLKQDCFKEMLGKGIGLQELNLLDIQLGSPQYRYLESLFTRFLPEHLVFAQRSRESTLSDCLQIDVIAISLICELFASFKSYPKKNVLLFTSPAAKFVQSAQAVAYHISKAAQHQMARYYAANYKKYGIRFNCIAPGAFVEKDRSKEFFASNKELTNSIIKIVPIGRFTQIQEIVYTANFLLSEESGAINGQEIYLDGGISIIDQSQFASND